MKIRRLEYENGLIGYQFWDDREVSTRHFQGHGWHSISRQELLKSMSATEIDASPLYPVLGDMRPRSNDPVTVLKYLGPCHQNSGDMLFLISGCMRSDGQYNNLPAIITALDAGSYGDEWVYDRTDTGVSLLWVD